MAIDFSTFGEFGGVAAPAVSPAGKGRLYFDSGSNTFKISQNGSAYANIGGGGGGGASVGLFSARPAPGTAGNIYFPTDGFSSFVDNGTVWKPLFNGVAGVQPPAAASFTALNASGSSVIADTNGALEIRDNSLSAAVPNYRGWHAALAGGHTAVEAIVWPAADLTAWNSTAMSYTFAGILFRESGTGKLAVFMIFCNPTTGSNLISCEYATSATTGRTVISGNTEKRLGGITYPSPIYLRMLISGGNVNYQYAVGRTSWQTIATVATTTAFTTTPDQYGLVVWPFNNNNPSSARAIVPHLTTY